jgi:nicotinamidase-related amidase
MLKLDPRRTALVLIDLQNWIVGQPRAPHAGDAVVDNGILLMDALKVAAGTIVLVRVTFSDGYADMVKAPVDVSMVLPEGGIPAEAVAFDAKIDPARADVIITKRHWGAFHGTELDLQLRRRGIDTVIVGGIATNFGVESTVREAYAHNYAVLVPEDACSSASAEMHRFSIETILPRISRIRSTAEIIEAIKAG